MRLPDIDYFVKYDETSRTFRPIAWKRSLVPGWLGFDPSIARGLLTIPTGGVTTFFRQNLMSSGGVRSNLESPFEARNLMFEDSTDGTASAAFTVAFRDQADFRDLQNQPVHIRTVAGTAQYPALLREPLFLNSNYGIALTAQKISGGNTTARINFGGVQYYPWGPDLDRDPEGVAELSDLINAWKVRRRYVAPYFLTTDAPNAPVVLTGNGTASAVAKIGDDGAFEAYAMAVVATGAFSLQIQEVRTKQYLMNGFETATSFIGNALLPTLFPVPYLIPASSKLQIDFKDLSGSTNTIYLTIQGRKIWAPLKDAEQVLRDTAIKTGMEQDNQAFPKPIIIGA